MNPSLSVVIPVYNAERYLSRCLDSILSCGFQDMEIIMVNDGSIDSSLQIIQAYADRYGCIKIINKANGGVSSARNEGLKAAEGEWIWFIDADDYLLDAARDEIPKLLSKDHDVVALSYIWEASQSEHYRGFANNGISSDECNGRYYLHSVQMSPTVWSYLFRRKMIEQYQIRMSEELKFGEDRVFVMEYLAHASRVFFSSVPLYEYYFSPQSAVHQNFMRNSREIEDQVLSVSILLEKLIQRNEPFRLYKYQIMFLVAAFLRYLKISSFEIEDFRRYFRTQKEHWEKMGYSSMLLNVVSVFFPFFVSHPFFFSIRVLPFYRRWQMIRNQVSP